MGLEEVQVEETDLPSSSVSTALDLLLPTCEAWRGRGWHAETTWDHLALECFTQIVLMSLPNIYKACTLDRVVLVVFKADGPILFVKL